MNVWKFLKNNIYIKNILLAIIVFVLIIVGVLVWLNVYTRHNIAVVVPDVKGMQINQAASFFAKRTLHYEVIDSMYLKDVTPGSIIETSPPAGTKVKEERTIFLIINAFSSQTILIPDVRDRSQRQATAMLNSLGFNNIEVEYVAGQYKDLVMGLKYNGKTVGPDDRLPLESKITLVVSSGEYIPESLEEDSLGTGDSDNTSGPLFD